MYIIEEEFQERRNEINEYFNLLFKIIKKNSTLLLEDGKIEKITMCSITILKSSSILLLYNLVESIITKCLDRIHTHICDNNVKYTKMSDNLKKLSLSYYMQAFNKNVANNLDSIGYFKNLLELSFDELAFNISYKDMTKFYSLYSGNLDSKQIRSVLLKYGIQYDKKNKELKTIKEKRNQLAHGEKSFNECGRDLSYEHLNMLKENTFIFIEDMIVCIKNFLENKEYISS